MENNESRTSLAFLDPENGDAGYWLRFRDRVMALAGPELMQRRAARPVTVGDVVLGWRNALVPTALLAAALAGLLLMQDRSFRAPVSGGYQQMLVSGLEESIPALVVSSLTAEGGALSSDGSF